MKHWRLRIILFLIFCFAAIIIGRLFYLQIFNHKFYQSQALGQQAGFKEIKGSRGEIFSENSKESRGNSGSNQINPVRNFVSNGVKSLAINEKRWQIFAIPKKIKDKNSFADTLSEVIKETKDSILSKLEKSDSYIIIKKDLLTQDVDIIKKLKLEGLYLESIPFRYYPEAGFASQIIGFLGGDSMGQYGIEGYYDDVLKGKAGIKEEKRGFDLINSEDISYLNGSDLYLTIDYNIQFQAELLLQEAKKDIDIESGQIIVLKPDSGRILALANFPSFDLNKYSKENNLDIFQDSSIQKIFEPGSIFKPFTMAMALNEGKVSPNTKFKDTGFVKIGPDTVYNFDHKIYNEQDMSGILEKSINTGAVFLSRLLPHQTFLDYIDSFGFNNKTGVDLQGEVNSKNEILRNGSDFGFATASFGQGIEMTPLQLARAFCAFANGGRIVKPYIVEKIVQGQKEEEKNIQPEILDPVISQKTVSEVTAMLINVVDRGFGKGAKINGYYLAGKTGTAQVPLKDKRGYDPDKTIQSFVGFGPALKPQFLILVKLDDPKVPQSSLSATPIFKKLSQYIIDYWQIPPDY